MKRYLVLFKHLDHFDVPEEKDKRNEVVIEYVISKMREGVVALLDYNEIHDLEFDNNDDGKDILIETSTIFEIRLLIDVDTVDFYDGGESVYYYVLEDMELNTPEIAYIYTTEDTNYIKTVIGIDVIYPIITNDAT